MATANPPPGALAVEHHNGSDPFLTSSQDPQRQRYSAFDNSQFSLYLNGSPVQAKRALQAHLAETTRRLQETSHLGNALVQQRKEIEEKMKEVEQQQHANDIGPELRQKLVELEKEFNEVGRETARAFLPKSRVPSGETGPTAGGLIYSSEAQHSPTKVSVPSRKQRNQQPTQINDIALATEISTSLLSQLKDLQAVLREKDEALKAADLDRSQLEIEVEGLSQRLRTLDESESRLKDVNWSLETQVRDSEALSKSAADKEHRLNQVLNLTRAEKSSLEREFEELKQQYAKLNDDHINKTKQHETELSGLRRNVAMGEAERSAMLRKVEELTTQNQDLAKAVTYRLRTEDLDAAADTSPDDGAEEGDAQTPEHSPPPSPSKATPRHGMLESETLKHSLQHAHRMIQQLKNNIHREKTEKIELKRMLQDARDEIDTTRSLNGPGSASKRRKSEKDVFKKPARPDRLGALRSGTQEIVVDDEEDWEEQEGVPNTPSRQPRPTHVVPGAFSSGFSSAAETSANEGFETANETSDAAFETANERDGMTTESDAFQTGAETLDGDSSDQLTETEAGPSRSTIRHSRSLISKGSHRDLYESTASVSGDEYDDMELRTPLHNQHSRLRLKARQSSSRRSTPRGGLDLFASTPPISKDSPASFVSSSNDNTPAQGKSLFAELNDLSGDDDDGSFAEDTPSRSSVLQSPDASLEAMRKSILERSSLPVSVPKPIMVDSSTMTEREPPKPVSMSSVWSQHTQPQPVRPSALYLSSLHTQDTSPQAPPQQDLRISSFSSQDTMPRRAPAPALHFSSVSGQVTTPHTPTAPALAISSFSAQDTTPHLPVVPLSGFSSMSAQHTAPQAVPTIPLNISSVSAHTTEPRAVPAVPLNISSINAHATEPRAVPAVSLGISSVSAHTTEPRAAPVVSLDMSSVSAHTTEPQVVAPPPLGLSTQSSHSTEPVAPVVEKSAAPSLEVSSIKHQVTEPKEGLSLRSLTPAPLLASVISTQTAEPGVKSDTTAVAQDSRGIASDEMSPSSNGAGSEGIVKRIPLQMSSLSAHGTEPRDVPRSTPSTFSTLSSQATEPKDIPRSSPSAFSAMSLQTTEPMDIPRPAPSTFSTMSSQATEPLALKRIVPQLSGLSFHATEPLTPRPPRLQMSTFSSGSTEPIAVPKPTPSHFSSLTFQTSQPVEPSRPSPSTFSTMSSQTTAPVSLPRTAPPELSVLFSQTTEPVQPRQRALPQVSTIKTQHTEPVAVPIVQPPQHHYSNVKTLQETQPESPTLPSFLPTPASRPSTANVIRTPTLSFSTVITQDIEPSIPSRPVTAHKTGPVPFAGSMISVQTEDGENKQSTARNPGFFDSILPWSSDKQSEPESIPASSRDSRMPLTPISANTVSKTPKTPTADGGTQTMVSAEQIDKLLLIRSQHRSAGTIINAGVEKSLSPPPSPSRRNSNEPGRPPRRPGSSGSVRSRAASPPPLPSDHKEVIAAAALKSLPPISPGAMGPPTIPASAYKKRPQTPSIRTSNAAPSPRTGGTTPRMRRHSQRGDARSGASSPISRRSSLSSFTSEIDQRFNIPGGPSFTPAGLPVGATDPRMIQAITQTMIGEYLWKYTRKTGREGMSENRHRRFFWIHPYTRTLYWSDRDPQSAGKSELKAKSVAIESVQEVEDNNPLPPGLHQKSLLVATPGRSIKFTATTGQRHETWYNALNYLCQRVGEGEQQPQEQRSTHVDEIQDEFNAGYRSSSRQTGRSRASMSSYVSRRASSPHHAQIPTLRPSATPQQRSSSTEPAQGSVSSRFSTMLRPASAMRGSFSSRQSRTSAQEAITYEEPSNTNMELGRDIHDHIEREIDGMPNVRACCDGKPLLELTIGTVCLLTISKANTTLPTSITIQ